MIERVVIVGASLAGGTAAASLREEGYEGSILLIGAEVHHPYERPPLSKSYLRGETSFVDALVRPESFYATNDIQLLLNVKATSLDPGARTVTVEGEGPIPFDRLLIATGARNRRLPVPGLDLEGVLGLRTLDDCERIRAEIEPGRVAVVVGMGFIGCEVTASLRQRGVEVTAVHGSAVPLQRILGYRLGHVLEGIHRDNGVKIIPGDRVAAFEGSERVERVVTSGGKVLECDFAVVGMGVEPLTELVVGSGIEVDDGVVVDEFCRTNADGVYAAGDVANHFHPVFAQRLRTEHWFNAKRQGRAAALSMVGKSGPYDEVPWFWSDQYEHNFQYAGFHREWDELVVRGSLEERNFLAFYMKDGRVQATATLSRGPQCRRSVSLIRAHAVVERSRLEDETLDIRTLV